LYNYRTGVVDTFIGRSMMRPDVPTLAEHLAMAGYRTGLFGKWHLGDNYPLRPEDQGFQQTLWHQGGGLAQPADHPDLDPKSAYFDPILKTNGQDVKTKGYCTDVFTNAAIKFLTADPAKPFFAYVAYNCPHGPFQVPDELAAPYRKLDLSPAGFPKVGQPWANKKTTSETIARAYGMIENVDSNFGRLMKALDDAKLAENTVVVFLTDNGPGGARFNAGLRARKGTVYEGGIRVPGYVRWPGEAQPGHVVEVPTAHIDVTPTLLGLCGVAAPEEFDGRDLSRLLKGEKVEWSDRTLFFQWHRGDVPEQYRAFAARGPRYKLVQAAGVQPEAKWTPRYELFDIPNDPFEQTDLAEKLPGEVAKLKKQYEAWFTDVTRKGFDPPRIVVGSEKEDPVRLSRQDWRGPKAGWAADSEGYWEVTVARAGKYRITLRSDATFTESGLSTDGEGYNYKSTAPTDHVRKTVTLKEGDNRFRAWVESDGTRRGVHYLEVEYIGAK
jgi:arylsulfatase A-like enzyme